MTAPAVENSAQNLAVREHNGGTLRSGNPGNKGGGRRPDRIKRIARRMLAERMPILGHIADGVSVKFRDNGEMVLVSPTDAERLSALKLLREIGDGDTIRTQDVRARMATLVEIVRSRPSWESEELLTALSSVWR